MLRRFPFVVSIGFFMFAIMGQLQSIGARLSPLPQEFSVSTQQWIAAITVCLGMMALYIALPDENEDTTDEIG